MQKFSGSCVHNLQTITFVFSYSSIPQCLSLLFKYLYPKDRYFPKAVDKIVGTKSKRMKIEGDATREREELGSG